jgi:hypothetical protein
VDLSLTKRAVHVARAAIALGKRSADGSYFKIRELSEEIVLPLRSTPQRKAHQGMLTGVRP